MSKILLISNTIPTDDNAGGILYDQIISAYGYENFNILSVSRVIKKRQISDTINRNVRYKQFLLTINDDNLFFKVLKRIDLFDYLFFKLNFFIKKKRIVNYVKDVKPEKILIKLRGEAIIIGDLIRNELGDKKIEYVGFIEDTVEREIENNSLLFKEKRKKYYGLLNGLKKVGVAGETMRDYIKNEFSIEAVILRPWYSDNTSERRVLPDSNSLNIFFAGNIYAKKEFNFFLDVLDFIGRKTKKKVKFFIASHKKIHHKSENFDIVNIGWVNQSELTRYMSKCDIGYLPYKSESEFKHSMMYAFPGKAGLYISNQLPIFFHGPNYSSVNEFLKNHYRVGFSSNELKDPKVISDIFASSIFNIEIQREYLQNCRTAYFNEFSESAFKKNVAKLLL